MLDLVVVTHNTKDLLKRLVNDIQRCTRDYNLIIIDNKSADGTKEDFEKFPNYIYNETNEGYAKACNKGAKLGKAEYICFMNADLVIQQPGWAQKMIDWMNKVSLAATGPRLIDEYGCKFVQKIDWLSGACLMVRREMFENLGGFDENYHFYYEDDDFCKKMKEAGCEFDDCWDSTVIHLYNRSPKTGNFREENLNKSKIYFDSKWGVKNDNKTI